MFWVSSTIGIIEQWILASPFTFTGFLAKVFAKNRKMKFLFLTCLDQYYSFVLKFQNQLISGKATMTRELFDLIIKIFISCLFMKLWLSENWINSKIRNISSKMTLFIFYSKNVSCGKTKGNKASTKVAYLHQNCQKCLKNVL